VTVLTLKLLLHSGHSSEGRGNGLDNDTRKTVPCENHSGTFPSNEFSQLSAEENDIKDRLGKVHVEAGKRSSPFLGVSSKALVRVTDSTVQIADFVVVHVLQILRVEMQSKALSEPERQLLLEVVEAGVDGGRRNSEHKESDNSLNKKSEVSADDSLYDLSIDICQPDTEHSSQD
jgi:hypothetical protein